jgi:F-type H+-transporting ATPase subunit b
MPQLDISTYPSQLFWLLITFTSLYFILSKFIIPRISRVLLKRSDAIDGKLRQAFILRQKSESLLADYESIIAGSRVKAEACSSQMEMELSKKMAFENKKIMDNISSRIASSEKSIANSNKEIINNISPQVIDLSQEILFKLTDKKLDKSLLNKYHREV